MSFIKVFGLITASALGTAGTIYGGHSVVDYVKERNKLKGRLDLAEYNLSNIEAKHRQAINTLVTERDNLKTALDKTRLALERGKDFIMNDIKKIRAMKSTLQGRTDLIYKSDKLLEEPYRKIAENFQNASYLTQT
ncbi:hypothetical protein A6V39_05755 [Candidatus Mycoplasma haematobovis]|uniref:Uncharacterized protein n=1 Tax=Candidatus Mycoplasma haematobovis TaxID=432608 RepID=A0A1A9QE99_9MOLU|nr:hypothetical protein [Candidatus Mycoplasma haematobovis]OAL10793.1 hypothetical protein A6V39_05755 [Candidatus Mycoplasma haematobovis]